MSKDLNLLNFLGPEFLTWLYFHLEENEGEVCFSDYSKDKHNFETSFRMCVGNRAVLRPLIGNASSVSIVSGSLDDSGEMLQAFRAGALLDVLSLEVHFSQHAYTFILNGRDNSISQFKLLNPFAEKSRTFYAEGQDQEENAKEVEDEAHVLLRMSALDEIEHILDSMFKTFLEKRLGSAFVSQEIKKMRANVEQRLNAKLTGKEQSNAPQRNENGEMYSWA